MTKAFVQNGIVTDIVRVDPFAIFQPAYAAQFVDAPDDVAPGWLYDGTTFYQLPKTVEQIQEEMIKACDTALTNHLDATAQTRKYDNRITCMVRAGFAGPFQEEAQAFAIWADSCNAAAYQYLSEVQAGTRPMPNSPQELIDVLPVMVWPAAAV